MKKKLTTETPVRIREILRNNENDRPQRNNNLQIHAIQGRISNDLSTVWNNLPNELKLEEVKLKQLIKKVKQTFFDNYKEQVCIKENCYICNN